MVVTNIYTYGVKIIQKFGWESDFLRGVPWNLPLYTNGRSGYLMQLSVNIAEMKIGNFYSGGILGVKHFSRTGMLIYAN